MQTLFRTRVRGLSQAQKIPGWIERGQRLWMETAAADLRAYTRNAAPVGQSNNHDHLRDHIDAHVLSNHAFLIAVEGVRYALALEVGRYSHREDGGPLRWFDESGRPIFREWSRGPATNWFKKALGGRGRIIRNAFELTMAKVDRAA